MSATKSTEVNTRQTAQNYRFTFEPESRRVNATFQGVTLADSRNAMRLEEGRLPPICYFPREDVNMDWFERSDYVSYCPFKGNATHYSLRRSDMAADNLLWSYEDPLGESAHIRDYVAFYSDQVDVLYPDDDARAATVRPDEPEVHVASDPLSDLRVEPHCPRSFQQRGSNLCGSHGGWFRGYPIPAHQCSG